MNRKTSFVAVVLLISVLSATGCDLSVGRAAPTPTIVSLAAAETNLTSTPTTVPTATPTEVFTATPIPLQPSDTPAPSRPMAEVTAFNLNVRAGPGTAYRIVGGLSPGDSVEVVGRNAAGDWLQIVYYNGRGEFNGQGGWIAAAYADPLQNGEWRMKDGGWRMETVPEVSAPPPPPPTATPPPTPTPMPELTGKLVFQVCNGCDIYVINAEGSGLRRLTDGMEPAWSPDGTKVAFARWRDPRGLYVIDEDGNNETLIFGWVAAKGPAWSPDGSRIAFTRWYGGQDRDTEMSFWGFHWTLPADHWWKLGIVRLEDGYFHDLRCYPHSLSPTWSPDGSVIAYDSDFGIHLTNEEGTIGDVTDDRSLFAISTDGRDISPVWSPDGSRIAFGFSQHDHWEIYVMDADGSNRVRLTQEGPFAERPPNNVSPAWSPDSRHIAFFTDRNGKWELYVMNADGSNQRPMFEMAPSTESTLSKAEGLRTGLDGLPIEYGFVAERMVSWAE